MQGGSGGSANESGGKKEDPIMTTLMDYKNRTPPLFNWIVVNEKVKEKTPFIVVCLQEVERMNELLHEINISLEDLKLGLEGALNMTDAMEEL